MKYFFLPYTIVMLLTKESLKALWTKNIKVRNTVFVVFGLIFLLFFGSTVVAQLVVTLTKAAPAGVVSIKDSFIIGSVILAPANGKDQAKVSVFLQDADGKPVSGKPVLVSGLPGAEGKSVVTNAEGQASFAGVSSNSGQFVVEASSGGQKIPGKIIVTFR